MNQTLAESLVFRHTGIKIYNTRVRWTLSYGSESRMISRTDERSLLSAEMHFVRQDVEYALSGHERNNERNTNSTNARIYRTVWNMFLG